MQNKNCKNIVTLLKYIRSDLDFIREYEQFKKQDIMYSLDQIERSISQDEVLNSQVLIQEIPRLYKELFYKNNFLQFKALILDFIDKDERAIMGFEEDPQNSLENLYETSRMKKSMILYLQHTP